MPVHSRERKDCDLVFYPGDDPNDDDRVKEVLVCHMCPSGTV